MKEEIKSELAKLRFVIDTKHSCFLLLKDEILTLLNKKEAFNDVFFTKIKYINILKDEIAETEKKHNRILYAAIDEKYKNAKKLNKKYRG
jgi:hypothetical protein